MTLNELNKIIETLQDKGYNTTTLTIKEALILFEK